MLGFTQGFDVRPFSAAFLARRPAAMSTDGFDVFVQLVIAAMTTLPSATSLSGAASFSMTLFFFDVRTGGRRQGQQTARRAG